MFLEDFLEFSSFDRHFSTSLCEKDSAKDPLLAFTIALASYWVSLGHVCLPLKELAGSSFQGVLTPRTEGHSGFFPLLDLWEKKLRNSFLVGSPGEWKPLILDQELRLYLYRYWDYENRLSHQLQSRIQSVDLDVNLNQLSPLLDQLFPLQTNQIDPQRSAALLALTKPFCVISGGPGTGKTTTVVKILALLSEINPDLRIALVAPTGKAAARLSESIQRSKKTLSLSDEQKQSIPEGAQTLHRLLQPLLPSARFRFNAQHPIPYDLLILDEASMVDLALMTKLIEATSPSTRLIFLGDPDQLSSIEAGNVLADLCALNGFSHQVHLTKSHRFDQNSGLGSLIQKVKGEEADDIIEFLRKSIESGLAWHPLPSPSELKTFLTPLILEGFKPLFRMNSEADALKSFDQFRILCALREGTYGVHGINQLVEKILHEEGILSVTKRQNNFYYPGCPLLITQNHYPLQLFNGDIGIVRPTFSGSKSLSVSFLQSEGIKTIPLSALPPHEKAYAMTVHKSQGSEFDRILFIAPDQPSLVMNRGLLYTAVSRAKKEAHLLISPGILRQTLQQSSKRSSGLADQLQKI